MVAARKFKRARVPGIIFLLAGAALNAEGLGLCPGDAEGPRPGV